MADKQMNQFTTATDGAYIYAEAADGSQVKISKADIINLLRNNLTVYFTSWEQLNTYADSMPNCSVIVFSSPQFVFKGQGFYGNYHNGFLHKLVSGMIIYISYSYSDYICHRIRTDGVWGDVHNIKVG